MGVVVKQEYECDLCGKAIPPSEIPFVGTLNVRKLGSRGLGRKGDVAAHGGCIDRLLGSTTSGPGLTNGAAKSVRKRTRSKAAAKTKVKATAV